MNGLFRSYRIPGITETFCFENFIFFNFSYQEEKNSLFLLLGVEEILANSISTRSTVPFEYHPWKGLSTPFRNVQLSPARRRVGRSTERFHEPVILALTSRRGNLVACNDVSCLRNVKTRQGALINSIKTFSLFSISFRSHSASMNHPHFFALFIFSDQHSFISSRSFRY